MGPEIDYRQNTGLRLEPEHALVVGLVLPGAAVHQRDSLVPPTIVTMHVPGDEYVGNGADDHVVLRFG